MLDQKNLRAASTFLVLVLVWLAAYKLAALLEVLPSYSSLWFLPAGVTLSVILAAPGWLKLSPLVANLLLAVPAIGTHFGLGGDTWLDQTTQAARHWGVYALAAYAIQNSRARPFELISVRGTTIYILIISLAAIASAALGVTLHVAMSQMSWQTAANIVVQWAIGDAVAALVITPILVPVLKSITGRSQTVAPWPHPINWLVELALILLAMGVGTTAIWFDPLLGSLWYLSLIPPIFAGVRNGMAGAAISMFLTTLMTPIIAKAVGFAGEPLALSVMLTIAAMASFLVGSAVSAQRESLTQLDRQKRILEQEVRDRTAALEDAYEFERHLVRSLGHDLRQPLQTIGMLVEGMVMRKPDSEPMLQTVAQINSTMSSFLDGVLNYAQSDPGSLKPHYSQFTLESLFGQLQDVYGPIAERRGVILAVHNEAISLTSDPVLLRQSLSNDLDNAIRLSAPGAMVTLCHEMRGGEHTLIVRDQIAVEYAHPPGTAGFGYGIVARICKILGAERVKEYNVRGMRLPNLPLPVSREAALTRA